MKTTHLLFMICGLSVGCDDADESQQTDATVAAQDGGDLPDGEITPDGGGEPLACDGALGTQLAACAAQAFLDSLSDDQRATAALAFTDSTNKTCWTNLPGQDRAGIAFGDLSDASRAAAMAVAEAVMTADGYQELRGLLAADDYLGEQGGGGPGGPGGGGGLAYTSDLAHIAIFGTPSVDGDWMLAIGNHHMAYNITFVGGVGYTTPSHQGAEPRSEFTINGETFGPLVSEGEALVQLFAGLEAAQLADAKLDGSFGDVLLGPSEYCSGVYDSVQFPTGDSRGGVLVSSLSEEQQTLVTQAIAEWLGDYEGYVSDALTEAYTSGDAYADTYVSWAGSGDSPDVETNGTYFRIDGPRVWIELSCQNGVVLEGTHYHSIFRDRAFDYGGAL